MLSSDSNATVRSRHVPGTGFGNGASTLKQYFVLPKNGSKHYLKYTFLAFPVLGILGLGTFLVRRSSSDLRRCALRSTLSSCARNADTLTNRRSRDIFDATIFIFRSRRRVLNITAGCIAPSSVVPKLQ